MTGAEEQSGQRAALEEADLRQPFENLVADGRRRLQQVERLLDEIDLQYRGRSEERSYRQFLTALRLSNQAAMTVLANSERKFKNTPRAAFDELKPMMTRLAGEHEKRVESLRSARAEALEVFSQPFTRLVKKLLPNAEVLFFGWKLERYEIQVFDANSAGHFVPGVGADIGREFGADFKFLQFLHPVLRQYDLFQHAAFAHELAHPLIRQCPPREAIEALGATNPTPNYENVATEHAHRQAEERGIKHEVKERKDLEDWFKEIACDIVGMRLLGPAFALAFAEVTSVNFDLERSAKDKRAYPPTRMRQKYLQQEVERFTFPAPWSERLPRSLTRAVATKILGDDPDRKIPGASAWMESAVATFRDHCVAPLLNGQELDQRDFFGRYGEISALIARGVPPAEKLLVTEVESPADPEKPGEWSEEYDWRLILNVTRIGLLDPEKEWNLDRTAACRLATGAIEMAEFQRRARKLREQYRLVGSLGTR